jgi:translation initiation factor IF-3
LAIVTNNNKGGNFPRANNEITATTVRLVDSDGAMLGVVNLREALARAVERGLDLVEISPNAEPPVCKILDYGKYKYEVQKRAHEAKKKQKVVEVKEIKLRPGIGENDYKVKLRSVIGFIEDGDKVRVSLRFRGREITHQEIGMRLLERLQQDTESLAKVESSPKMDGKQLLMILAPLKA